MLIHYMTLHVFLLFYSEGNVCKDTLGLLTYTRHFKTYTMKSIFTSNLTMRVIAELLQYLLINPTFPHLTLFCPFSSVPHFLPYYSPSCLSCHFSLTVFSLLFALLFTPYSFTLPHINSRRHPSSSPSLRLWQHRQTAFGLLVLFILLLIAYCIEGAHQKVNYFDVFSAIISP